VRSVIKINDVTAGALDLGVCISNFSNTLAVLHVHEGLADANGPVVTNLVERPMRGAALSSGNFPRDHLRCRGRESGSSQLPRKHGPFGDSRWGKMCLDT
jgi:hypothetical protein